MNAGSHEIQADLILNDNVTATALVGTMLNINSSVVLNGKTFTTAGAGTINLNNGTVASGSGGGSGGWVNEGDLSGLASLAGDFSQTDAGSLSVEVGGSVVEVLGDAVLDGMLDVSLADGFVPTLGDSYTVLTANSVTDAGLALSGDAASMFNLVIGNSSISLVAVGVPEPSTVFLATLGLAAGAYFRPRRCRRGDRRRGDDRSEESGPKLETCVKRRILILTTLLTATIASAASAVTLVPSVTPYSDDFNTFFDYAAGGGAVPGGSIWSGIHNQTNGGDASTPAILEANGADFNGNPKPGVLFIEDLVLHPNTDGQLGVGWEGDKNNAPFLFANVDAGNDFEAVIKINAQTAGFWSYTGIIARRPGAPPNPVGLGPGDTLAASESFITTGSFRTTDTDDPATTEVDETLNATILTQNIVNLNETEANDGVVLNGLPLWIRMTKKASQFTAASSLDGTTWADRNVVINPELNTAGELLEIGPSHMMFTSGGTAVFGQRGDRLVFNQSVPTQRFPRRALDTRRRWPRKWELERSRKLDFRQFARFDP